MKQLILSILLVVTSVVALAKSGQLQQQLEGYGAFEKQSSVNVTADAITASSPVGLEETVARVGKTLEMKGLRVFINKDELDPSTIEMQVLPGELLIYGSYRRAKSITRCSMDVLDDLPDSLIISNNRHGGVTITAGNPESLNSRDDGSCGEVLAMLSDAMQDIVSLSVKG